MDLGQQNAMVMDSVELDNSPLKLAPIFSDLSGIIN